MHFCLSACLSATCQYNFLFCVVRSDSTIIIIIIIVITVRHNAFLPIRLSVRHMPVLCQNESSSSSFFISTTDIPQSNTR